MDFLLEKSLSVRLLRRSQAIRRAKEVKGKQVNITDLTELLGYTKQSYYKKIKTKEMHDIQETLVMDLVKEKRKFWKNLC